MTKKPYVFDEDSYPIAWRFNSEDCLLSDSEKKRIVLFDEFKSEKIWDLFIPTKNLMEIGNTTFKQHEKTTLNFNNKLESSLYFERKIDFPDFIWFFWGRSSAAMVSRSIFLKSWDDFFYPSDENSILIIPNTSKVIFSFEDSFFYGELLRPIEPT
ncbi:hypothetical protein ACVNP3_17360 [Pseudomonas chlororaphis subsp. piscium]